MKLSAPSTPRAPDPLLEQIRLAHEAKIVELQRLPAAGLGVVNDIELVDGVPKAVPHKLGRVPTFVKESCVRGAVSAGYVAELRDGSVDRTKYVLLKASGFGATITVDVQVL